MKKRYILIFLLFLIYILPMTANAVNIDFNTRFEIDNQIYWGENLDITMIQISDTYLGLNETYFNITNAPYLTLNITQLIDSTLEIGYDEPVLTFVSYSQTATAEFNISGFNPVTCYNLTIDGTYYDSYNSTNLGYINFSYVTNGETYIFSKADFTPPIDDITISNIVPTNNTCTYNNYINFTADLTHNNGKTFNWTIECNNTQNNSGTDDISGTKTLNISGLTLNTTYSIWVNFSSGDVVAKSYNYTYDYCWTIEAIPEVYQNITLVVFFLLWCILLYLMLKSKSTVNVAIATILYYLVSIDLWFNTIVFQRPYIFYAIMILGLLGFARVLMSFDKKRRKK